MSENIDAFRDLIKAGNEMPQPVEEDADKLVRLETENKILREKLMESGKTGAFIDGYSRALEDVIVSRAHVSWTEEATADDGMKLCHEFMAAVLQNNLAFLKKELTEDHLK